MLFLLQEVRPHFAVMWTVSSKSTDHSWFPKFQARNGPISLLCTLTPLFPRSVHTPSNCPKMTGYSKYILIKIPYPCTLCCQNPISVHTLLSKSQKCAHSNGQWFAISHIRAHLLSSIPKMCTWEMVSVSRQSRFHIPQTCTWWGALCAFFYDIPFTWSIIC